MHPVTSLVMRFLVGEDDVEEVSFGRKCQQNSCVKCRFLKLIAYLLKEVCNAIDK